MDPARLGALLNEYYAQLFVPVERSHGVVVDVVGDAMVAVWAKVSSSAQVCRQACEASLIAEALERFNGVPQRPTLTTRFGLHAGDMLFGSMGAVRALRVPRGRRHRQHGVADPGPEQGPRHPGAGVGRDGAGARRPEDPTARFLSPCRQGERGSDVELVGREVSVDSQTADRCRSFASALEAYAAGRVEEAARGFAAVLEAHPDDGPSRFYRAHCERLRGVLPHPAWTATIVIDSK